MDGWMDGWMNGWMDGWTVELKKYEHASEPVRSDCNLAS